MIIYDALFLNYLFIKKPFKIFDPILVTLGLIYKPEAKKSIIRKYAHFYALLLDLVYSSYYKNTSCSSKLGSF